MGQGLGRGRLLQDRQEQEQPLRYLHERAFGIQQQVNQSLLMSWESGNQAAERVHVLLGGAVVGDDGRLCS